MTAHETRSGAILADSPIFTAILSRWASIKLPDCWLSGSAIAQTAWNAAFGLLPEYGLADIDLVFSMPPTCRKMGKRGMRPASALYFPT